MTQGGTGLRYKTNVKARPKQREQHSSLALIPLAEPQVSIVARLEACSLLSVQSPEFTRSYTNVCVKYLERCVWLILSLLPAIYAKLFIPVEIVFFQAADQHPSASVANQQLISQVFLARGIKNAPLIFIISLPADQ